MKTRGFTCSVGRDDDDDDDEKQEEEEIEHDIIRRAKRGEGEGERESSGFPGVSRRVRRRLEGDWRLSQRAT